jgi:hypothetical protein
MNGNVGARPGRRLLNQKGSAMSDYAAGCRALGGRCTWLDDYREGSQAWMR